MTKVGDIITLAALGGVALLVFKNKDTIVGIGSGINNTVSGALKTIQSKVVKDASKD